MKKIMFALGLLLLPAVAARAQVTSAELASMHMWPSPNPIWLGTKWFSYQGDYGYYLDPTPGSPMNLYGQPTDIENWRFAYYVGIAGQRVIAYGDWGLPAVPSPVVNPDGRIGDNCLHSHLSYGVWLQYGFYSGGVYYSGFIAPSGGTKSGVRVNNNLCTHSVNNTLSNISPDHRYGWGVDYVDITFGNPTPFVAMIVGASAISHGSFGCSAFACINQPYIIAYTLPH